MKEIPRFNFYVSGKLSFEYEYENDAWERPFLFELERTEISYRPLSPVYITLGRQRFRDELIASGLFDGLSASIGFNWGRIFAGLYYTGLLYKKTAEIVMTPADAANYSKPWDYGDLSGYFASRRILAPLTVAFTDLSPRTSLALTVLAQFDMNEGPSLHTQYLEAQYRIEAADTLRFALTGVGGLAEAEGEDIKLSLAAAVLADWDVPGSLKDMLSGELRWGSGAVNKTIGPFTPVNSTTWGTVFTPAMSAMMNARLSYTVRPREDLSFFVQGIGFWRTDLETFTDAELKGGSESRFLGTELDASLVWALQSALRFSAGGGVFFPGGAFVSEAPARWKLNTGLSLSL